MTIRMVPPSSACVGKAVQDPPDVPTASLISGSTMTIMPRKSALAPIYCRFCHDMPRILPFVLRHRCTDLLTCAYLCAWRRCHCNCACTIACPWCQLSVKSSGSSYTAGSLQQYRWSPCSGMWHAAPGAMLPVGARPPLRHASSWLRGSAYVWTCAVPEQEAPLTAVCTLGQCAFGRSPSGSAVVFAGAPV